MRLDGTGMRQLTEGGNPFYTRFSPDGRRLLYSDGTTDERRGIWVVDFDGKNRRRVVATGETVASACWSPDGKQIAVMIFDLAGVQNGVVSTRIEIQDLDGDHRTFLTVPDLADADMPDWR
jgi:Tol biopolymer transport system component